MKKYIPINIRQLHILLISIAVILLFSKPAYAYEEDTHFLMTYVMLKSVGFTHEEALLVAAADQGMDDSPGTVANGNVGGVIPNVTEEWLWHALDMDGNMHAKGILIRKEYLFNLALQQFDMRNKLIYLGVFFHYQQDTWAHRHHVNLARTAMTDNHLSYDGYTTYNTPLGHARDFHQPDRPPLDPVCALMCLEDGVLYAADFLQRGLGRQPDPFFTGYVPSGGMVDYNWNDNRQGKFFNQIDLNDSEADTGSAHYFLKKLIRIQIEQYPSVKAKTYLNNKVADNVSFNKVRDGLQEVCNSFASSIGPIVIPSQTEKLAEGFKDLTTVNLFALNNPISTMAGEYHIKVKASGQYLYVNENADALITVNSKPTGEPAVFIPERLKDGTYRIRMKADNRYLHLEACVPQHWLGTKLDPEKDDPFTRFILEKQLEGDDYKLKVKANEKYLWENDNSIKIISTVSQATNDLTKFTFEKI